MKRWQHTLIRRSGADLIYDATPLPVGDTVIVRVYYPDLDIGNKVLISFEPWIF